MGGKDKNPENYFDSASDMIERYAQLNANTWKNMNEMQLNFANLWMEFVKASLDKLSTARNADDIFTIESELITEYSEKFSENMRQAFDTVSSAQTELMEDFFKGCRNPFLFTPKSQETTTSKQTKERTRKKESEIQSPSAG